MTEHDNGGSSATEQLPIPFSTTALLPSKPSLGVTFQESKRQPFHRWYPYVEGFSAAYVQEALDRFGPVEHLYDPFGGAGTAQVEASRRGVTSYYSEVNPFMRFVAETKVTSTQWARANATEFERLCTAFLQVLRSSRFQSRANDVSLTPYEDAFPARDFFKERHLRHLLAVRDLAQDVAQDCEHGRNLLLLSIAANTVRSSNMTRRADLRRRRPDEYKERVVDVPAFVEGKLSEIRADLQREDGPHAPMNRMADDCRSALGTALHEMDLAITSPPYLNGTNYFRNTKLELWLLGYLKTERDLRLFTAAAVAGGINNVSRDRPRDHAFDSVERVAEQLAATDGDQRIALLVRYYFSDMFDVLRSVLSVLRPGGRFLLDIGDSKFYGVHVPTDRLLMEVAQAAGFEIESERFLARRLSYDKTELKQVEVVFRRPVTALTNGRRRPAADRRSSLRAKTESSNLRDLIKRFQTALPYKAAPYSSRSWGDPLHSLCSYQGKLKPAIAHWLVELFTEPGMAVLDPLGGVGTIAFEACLSGRYGITNDLSPLASTVATGKVRRPSQHDVEAVLDSLERALSKVTPTAEEEDAATFGLNGTVHDYYHERTLGEILRARSYFLALEKPTDSESFVKANLLHILHGNRPYALSRTSHPITPFHPSGPRTYRSVTELLRRRVMTILGRSLPPSFVHGRSLNHDFRCLAQAGVAKVDRVITSPPFWGMRFDRPNWLRMWFCGWRAEDFHKRSLAFLERQQTQSLAIYREFFSSCRSLLRPEGLMIMHLGGSDKHNMLGELTGFAAEAFEVLDVVSEDVSDMERHGIKDKGLTTTHNFLFLGRQA